MRNLFDQLLSPFRGFDMNHLYNTYGGFIDGLLFFCIFLGLAKHSLKNRFPGRAGNLVAVALSFMLTMGLLLAEKSFNFNLKSFGGIAVGAAVLVTGIFIFGLVRSSGAGIQTAFFLSYLLVYLSLAAMVPNIFDFIADRAPFLNGLAGLGFLISIFVVMRALFLHASKSWSSSASLPTSVEKGNGQDDTSLKQAMDLENAEIRILKKIKTKMANLDDIELHLRAIEKVIREHPQLDAAQAKYVTLQLGEMAKKEALFTRAHSQLARNAAKLGKFNQERLNKLEGELDETDKKTRPIKEKEIEIERRKLEFEEHRLELKTDLDKLVAAFNGAVRSAIARLSQDRNASLAELNRAAQNLDQAKKVIAAMTDLEKRVIDLAKAQKGLYRSEIKKKK